MTKRLMGLAVLLVSAVLGVVVTAAMAAPAPEKKRTAADVARAEKAAREHLDRLKGAAGAIEYVKDEAVVAALPNDFFFTVLFRQYPVARVTPEGLKASNVFAVDGEGKVEVLTDAKMLEKFFKDHLRPAREEAQMKEDVKAWLRLVQVIHQDGFFQFSLMDDSVKVTSEKGGKAASGTVVAMRGGSGTLSGTLTFDEAGKLTKATEESKLRPGPRPICQATKLLDRDPLVRRMAEQDLLIMGSAARGYLDEQRARAVPELQQAIDRIWQRIQNAEK
jgi:hypothetical protein